MKTISPSFQPQTDGASTPARGVVQRLKHTREHTRSRC
ncbi:unnamed protein product, partial [Ascophyllum nodosum]